MRNVRIVFIAMAIVMIAVIATFRSVDRERTIGEVVFDQAEAGATLRDAPVGDRAHEDDAQNATARVRLALGVATPAAVVPPPTNGVRVRVEDVSGAAIAAVPVGRAVAGRALFVETASDGSAWFDADAAMEQDGAFVWLAVAGGWGATGPVRVSVGGEHVFRIAGLGVLEVVVRGAREGTWVGTGYWPEHGVVDRGVHEALAGRSLVRWPVVASSGRFVVYAAQPGELVERATQVDAPGPGEWLRVELDCARPPIEIAARAVADDGRALVRTSLAIHVRVEPSARRGWPGMRTAPALVTDDDGRFTVGFDETWEGVRGEIDLAIPGGAVGRIEFDAMPIGRRDVGDVAFAPPPRFAIGSTVDERGDPVEGATIELYSQSDPGDERRFTTRTDGDGTFEFLGLRPRGEFILSARAVNHVAVAEDLGHGAPSENHLVLVRAARVQGRVVTADGAPASGVVVFFERPDGVRPDGFGRAVDTDGRFEMDDVRPGRTRLVVRAQHRDDDIVAFDIDLEPGDVVDPRFDPIRLPVDMATLELAFVDPDGRTPSGLTVFQGDNQPAPSSMNAFWPVGATRPGEPYRLTVRPGSIDVAAVAPGFRRVALRAVDASATVVMERAPSIELVFDRSGLRVAEDVTFTATVTCTSADGSFLVGRYDLRAGSTTADIPARGAYTVTLVVSGKGPPRYHREVLGPFELDPDRPPLRLELSASAALVETLGRD